MRDPPDRDVAVFTEALLLPIDERPAYLDRACGNDDELRQKVEALLKAHNQIGDFLENSPQEVSLPPRPGAVVGEKPGDRIGRFKLLQQIGEGGCGVVFMAEQEEPVRRRVALKIIKPGMDTKSVIARFEAERQALALMDHPNIAKIFDAGSTESGRPYFVMELVRGIKITEYCDQHSLTTEERLELFAQVCQAVQHAHQKGVIHRDIKPSNILVTATTGGSALPVVIDFGIAKATTNQRLTDKTLFTAFEMLIGTPAYMSPEQAALTGVDMDTRTDIYSLGVLLYELLTGSTPFDTGELLKAGLDEIRRVIREQEPARPSTRLSKLTAADLTSIAQHRKSEPPTLIHTIRGDLDWIAMKALEKDRARRYETANGMALDIRRYLANEPVSARPPSKLYKLQKTVLRNKVLFAGIGVIVLMLVASLIVVSASLGKERQARREAEAASVKSKQVTKFLKDMLNGVGPSFAAGRDTTMLREIFDRTAKGVDKEITNQPAVEAELRDLLGRLYEQIGKFDQAEAMHRAALKINRELFGAESKEAATSLNNLGVVFMGKGQVRDGEEVDREALAIRRRLFGTENADTARSLNDLSALYRQDGRIKEAEVMAREALGIRQRLFGVENLDVADSLRNLSIILGDQEKWNEAEAMAREVLAMRRKLLGADHPWVASSLCDVAWAAGARGKQDEAEALQREALAMRRKLLPAEHPDVVSSLSEVGDTLRKRGNLNEADSVLSAALAMQRKVLGKEDLQTLYTVHRLGLTLEAEGKWSEAEALYRESLVSWRNRGGDDDPQSLYTMHRLGIALEKENKWPEAEAVHREELTLWRKRAGENDPKTLYAVRNLANTLELAGKWPEVESLNRAELAGWRKWPTTESQQLFYSRRKLALTLETQNKWPEAEALFRESLSQARLLAGNEDPEALTDLERLVRVLILEKKFGEAEQLLGEMLTPAFVKKPACITLLVERIDIIGRRGRWAEAAADAGNALELQPDEHYRYHTLVGLLAMTHDRPAYDQLCQRALTKFGNSTNPYVAERIVQDSLLLPRSGVDLALVDKLADLAVALGSGESSLPYFQGCKAMSNYRQGHFPEAVDWAEKAEKSPTAKAQAKAKAYAVSAMAHWRLGQKGEARAALVKGDTLAPKISSERDGEDLGGSWVAWLFARISLDEATALIESGSTTGSNPNQP